MIEVVACPYALVGRDDLASDLFATPQVAHLLSIGSFRDAAPQSVVFEAHYSGWPMRGDHLIAKIVFEGPLLAGGGGGNDVATGVVLVGVGPLASHAIS